ncbi:MAG: hypothetical protein ACLU99_08510 [Alphaproteobacteria bacterium]
MVFLTGAKDPDEFLKAFGRDEFLKVISNTVPLKDLLWQKNTEASPVSTPEQKALVEKNIKEGGCQDSRRDGSQLLCPGHAKQDLLRAGKGIFGGNAPMRL